MFTFLESLTNSDRLVTLTMLELLAGPLDRDSPFEDCHNAPRGFLESSCGLFDSRRCADNDPVTWNR